VNEAQPDIVDSAGRTRRAAMAALLRPNQWLKNGLVFAALLFSGHLFHVRDLILAAGAFVAFCAISSAGYTINDITDRETDRHHPDKRNRPIAAGEISVGAAAGIAAVLAVAGLALSLALGRGFVAIAATYVAMQFFYSWYAKHVVIADVITIAAGFVLRAYGGGVAIGVPVSPWLIFITFVLALFLALARRRHELSSLGEAATLHRGTLGAYSVALVDQMISIVAAATLVGYMIYTASPEVAEKLHTQYLFLTVPFVVFGILRYLYLVSECDGGGDPAQLILRDPPLLVSIVLWVLIDIALLYL
jgi:4-hydroxybenzoate polyprenyltransferase